MAEDRGALCAAVHRFAKTKTRLSNNHHHLHVRPEFLASSAPPPSRWAPRGRAPGLHPRPLPRAGQKHRRRKASRGDWAYRVTPARARGCQAADHSTPPRPHLWEPQRGSEWGRGGEGTTNTGVEDGILGAASCSREGERTSQP